ncbi:MAG: thioredoxin [Phycisphaerales bacterium]|nr:MAG: thioredoxin [Phycisphaerales bacterium]
MANANVKEFTDANFDAEVLKSSNPVLVDFWAEWCMPCRNLAPVIDAVADDFAGKAKVGKVDTDANQAIAVKYGITAIPTVIVFKGGQPVKKFVGFQKKDILAAALSDAGAA